MQTETITLTTDAGSVLVEVDRNSSAPGGSVPASGLPSRGAARARETFDEVLDAIRPTVIALDRWAREVAPEECCIEFGVKLGGETSVVIAKGTAEVNFVFKLTWRRDGGSEA